MLFIVTMLATSALFAHANESALPEGRDPLWSPLPYDAHDAPLAWAFVRRLLGII